MNTGVALLSSFWGITIAEPYYGDSLQNPLKLIAGPEPSSPRADQVQGSAAAVYTIPGSWPSLAAMARLACCVVPGAARPGPQRGNRRVPAARDRRQDRFGPAAMDEAHPENGWNCATVVMVCPISNWGFCKLSP